MRRRLVILTEIIAPYRIPVFNTLAQCSEIDLQVIFLAESDPKLRDWLVYKDEIRFSYQVLPSWRREFAGQVAFYLAACAFLLKTGPVRSVLLKVPHYFCISNAAILTATFRFLSGERREIWSPTKR